MYMACITHRATSDDQVSGVGVEYQEYTLVMNQKAKNKDTTAAATRHVLTPPPPSPNAWLTLRVVWFKESPNDEK